MKDNQQSAALRLRTQYPLLPDFRSTTVVFISVVSAELLALILTLASEQGFWFALALNSVFIQWVTLFSLFLLYVVRPWLEGLHENWVQICTYALILMVSFICSEFSWWLFYSATHGFWSTAHLLFVARILGITAIVAGLVLRYLYIQYCWRHEMVAVASAKFDALQAKIRPHFLFNVMNTIASLIRKDAVKAEQAVEDLSDLLRASLLDSSQLVTLGDELVLCKRYLRIERHRLGDRLQVHWNIDSLPEDALFPMLSIQPILENAIYYGIEPLAAGGKITIYGELLGAQLQIHIKSPLPLGSNVPVIIKSGYHMAQDNIRQRLLALFGDQAMLAINEGDTDYIVTLTLPYKNG